VKITSKKHGFNAELSDYSFVALGGFWNADSSGRLEALSEKHTKLVCAPNGRLQSYTALGD
jgi:hypothetical protein